MTTWRPAQLRPVQLWLSTVVRVGLAVVWLLAGAAKAGDLAGSVRAVRAYRLLPSGVAPVVGSALPFVEILVGLLLLAGLATRLAAVLSAVLLTAFIVGISAAAIRGLRIECGCFGGGGQLGAQARPAYALDLVRDGALFGLSGLLAIWARSRLSADAVLMDA